MTIEPQTITPDPVEELFQQEQGLAKDARAALDKLLADKELIDFRIARVRGIIARAEKAISDDSKPVVKRGPRTGQATKGTSLKAPSARKVAKAILEVPEGERFTAAQLGDASGLNRTTVSGSLTTFRNLQWILQAGVIPAAYGIPPMSYTVRNREALERISRGEVNDESE